MKSLVFDYLPFPKRDPATREIIDQVYYPFIPLRIIYKHQLYRNPVHCLLDSGSERNLLPAFLGEQMGIKVKKGKIQKILGIGGIVIEGFTHEVTFYLDTLSFKTEVDFSYEQEVPILGRTGFFDKFRKVIFKENEKIIELEVNSKK